MEKLSKEEVLHIADLAMLDLTEEEIDKYSIELKALFNEIDKVNSVDIDTDSIFSNSEESMIMFNDEYVEYEEYKELINNAPNKSENFIEVAGVFDE